MAGLCKPLSWVYHSSTQKMLALCSMLMSHLVEEADPDTGSKGLFSQEDIIDMLQLDPEDNALFFSLDPPSSGAGKSFHPFQQWRHPAKIKGTEVFHCRLLDEVIFHWH